jgi:hypothetical protein
MTGQQRHTANVQQSYTLPKPHKPTLRPKLDGSVSLPNRTIKMNNKQTDKKNTEVSTFSKVEESRFVGPP